MVGMFVLLCIGVCAVSGYFQGLMRQLVSVAALLLAVVFAGPVGALVPDALPESMNVPLALIPGMKMAMGGMIVLVLASVAGSVVAKGLQASKTKEIRAEQQKLDRFRGSFFGAAKGLLLALVILMIVYNLGQVAEIVEARVASPTVGDGAKATTGVRAGAPAQRPVRGSGLRHTLAAIKRWIGDSAAGPLVRQANVVDAKMLRDLGDIIDISNDPNALRRLKEHPDVKRLMEVEQVRELVKNPEVVKLVREHQFLELLNRADVAAAAQDSRVKALAKQVDLEGILAFAKGDPAKK